MSKISCAFRTLVFYVFVLSVLCAACLWYACFSSWWYSIDADVMSTAERWGVPSAHPDENIFDWEDMQTTSELGISIILIITLATSTVSIGISCGLLCSNPGQPDSDDVVMPPSEAEGVPLTERQACASAEGKEADGDVESHHVASSKTHQGYNVLESQSMQSIRRYYGWFRFNTVLLLITASLVFIALVIFANNILNFVGIITFGPSAMAAATGGVLALLGGLTTVCG